MTGLEQALLPARASSLAWIAILFVVLLLTFDKLRRMKGEHWWHHFTHFIMLAAMLYMYAAMAFRLEWISRRVLMGVFIAISAGVVCWMFVQLRQRGSVGKHWAPTLVQQVSMVYMCVAAMEWIPWLTYALVLYFAVETLIWSAWPWPSMRWPKVDDLCMAAMAASMGYMFLGMQLKASQKRAEAVAARVQPKVQTTDGGPPAAQNLPQAAPVEAPAISVATAGTAPAEVYEIVAGDSLYRIAARRYGDGRRWPEVAAANPDLDPKRLRAGRIIKLPPKTD